jgi:hypothetical protein
MCLKGLKYSKNYYKSNSNLVLVVVLIVVLIMTSVPAHPPAVPPHTAPPAHTGLGGKGKPGHMAHGHGQTTAPTSGGPPPPPPPLPVWGILSNILMTWGILSIILTWWALVPTLKEVGYPKEGYPLLHSSLQFIWWCVMLSQTLWVLRILAAITTWLCDWPWVAYILTCAVFAWWWWSTATLQWPTWSTPTKTA